MSGNPGEANLDLDPESFFGVVPKAGLFLNVGEQIGVFGELDYNAVFSKDAPRAMPHRRMPISRMAQPSSSR